MSAAPLAAVPAPPRLTRRNHGQGHSYYLDGEKVEGVTTIIGAGVPKPALTRWAANLTAGYAVDHWDELGQLGIVDRLKRISSAPDEMRNARAVRGTLIHHLAQQLSAGHEIDVPDDVAGHVDSYLKFAHDWGVVDVVVERPLASAGPYARYAGTLDLIADFYDGERWLLDFKTGASGVYREAALQLAAYRYADFFIDIDGREQTLPSVERTGVVWLRADGYDLIPVTADEHVFRTFQYVAQVARFARSERDDYIDAALTPPPVAT